MRPAPNRIRTTASTTNQCDRLKVPMTVAPQHARTNAATAPPVERAHGQRRFRGWMSGRRAGGCACGADGAALKDASRFAAKRPRGLHCEHGLVGGWPKQRRFGRRQPERGVEQRQARQYARRERLGWPQSGRRLFTLRSVVRDERFLGGGGKRRQLDWRGGTGERGERQQGSEPCRKPALQHVASMRPRAHRHLGRLPRATDAARSRRQSAAAKMILARVTVKCRERQRRQARTVLRAPLARSRPSDTHGSGRPQCDSPGRRLRLYSPPSTA